MGEVLSVVTRKYQVTVPLEIRRVLGLRQGDKVAFEADREHGEVRLRRVTSVADATYAIVEPRSAPADPRRLRQQAIEDIAANAVQEGLEPVGD